jgi:hypothetical protein
VAWDEGSPTSERALVWRYPPAGLVALFAGPDAYFRTEEFIWDCWHIYQDFLEYLESQDPDFWKRNFAAD